MLEKDVFLEVINRLGIKGLDECSDLYKELCSANSFILDSNYSSMKELFLSIKFTLNSECLDKFNLLDIRVFSEDSRDFFQYLIIYPNEYSFIVKNNSTLDILNKFYENNIDFIVYNSKSDYKFDRTLSGRKLDTDVGYFKYYCGDNYKDINHTLDKVNVKKR